MSHATMAFGSMPNSFGEVKGTLEARKLRYVAKHRGLIHVDRAVPAFDETNDVLVEQSLLVFIGNLADARFTAHKFLKGILGKHTVHARQPQRNTGDHVGVNIPL